MALVIRLLALSREHWYLWTWIFLFYVDQILVILGKFIRRVVLPLVMFVGLSRLIIVVWTDYLVFLLLSCFWEHIYNRYVLAESILVSIAFMVLHLIRTYPFLDEVLNQILLAWVTEVKSLENLLVFCRNYLKAIIDLLTNVNNHSIHLDNLIIYKGRYVQKINLNNRNEFCYLFQFL